MNQTIENNISKTEQIIETLDLNLEDHTYTLLTPLYKSEYGSYLTQTFFDIPLGNIIAAFLALCFFLFLRKMFTTLTLKILQPLAQRTKTFYDDRILSALKGPISFIFVIIGGQSIF